MRTIILLTLCVFLSHFTIAQNFVEICPSSTTNGTIVDCQYYRDSLYATGFFTTICDQPVGHIARWDDNTWVPTAINIPDPGHSLQTINNKLYIAKYENSIDSNWVYVYDNDELQKLGDGVYLTTASGFSQLPNIYDITYFNGEIIACGEFDRVGSSPIQGIMRWDGTSWSALGDGLGGNIDGTGPVMFPHQMLVHGSTLYVVGNFKTAGGIEVNGIAAWDGTEWSTMGVGFNSTVYSIIVYKNEVIVGGSFTESDGETLNRIAKWTGSSWAPLDFGFSQPSTNDFIFVHTLESIDGVLYIGGGLKEIIYSDNTTQVCNGVISLQDDVINTYMGGTPGYDIEAICKVAPNHLLVGGGVFGNGYSALADLSSGIHEHMDIAPVTLSPNPFIDHLTISTDVQFDSYALTNEAGQIVDHGNYSATIHPIAAQGTYFLSLYKNDVLIAHEKVVKIGPR